MLTLSCWSMKHLLSYPLGQILRSSEWQKPLLSTITTHFYLHIPFCRQRCPYCKFALTPVFDEFKKRRYIEYLKKEIREYFVPVIAKNEAIQVSQNTEHGLLRTSQWRKQKTIYFGGWTPSVLSHDEIREILECFPFYRESGIEITMEMNPEDVTPEYIAGVLGLGINRISLGIQTLNEASLKEIHRSDRNTIFGALESISPEIKKSNNNISLNIDFILGLPFTKPWETLAWIRELHERFPYITNTSVYMLEDEAYPRHWKENWITEDEMQSEFLAIMDYLESTWWHHYELSNWARPGYESVHNQGYWDHSETRGFGLSAASYELWNRWSNSSSFTAYYGWKRDNEEQLTPADIEIEQMMFGMRRGGWESDKKSPQLDTLISDWLLEIYENRIKPTKTWIFLLDHILSELM